MSKVLHVFGSTFDFYTVDPQSTLLTQDQLAKIPWSDVCHTSLGDLTINDLINIAPRFDQVVFHASTYQPNSSEWRAVQYCMNVISRQKPVQNYTVDAVENFADWHTPTRPASPVLWSFGCSYLDFADPEIKFDQVLAQRLQIPLQRVAKTAKTTAWALRQIAMANIQAGDTVIWFVTPNKEKVAVLDDIVYSKLPKHLSQADALNWFVKISNVHIGVNLLRARNANTVLLSVQNVSDAYYDFFEALSRYPEFMHTHALWCDFASDGEHYGPLTHKNIALALYDRVQSHYD
jgi:hypothetical protein